MAVSSQRGQSRILLGDGAHHQPAAGDVLHLREADGLPAKLPNDRDRRLGRSGTEDGMRKVGTDRSYDLGDLGEGRLEALTIRGEDPKVLRRRRALEPLAEPVNLASGDVRHPHTVAEKRRGAGARAAAVMAVQERVTAEPSELSSCGHG
jgi:hypothetical protein